MSIRSKWKAVRRKSAASIPVVSAPTDDPWQRLERVLRFGTETSPYVAAHKMLDPESVPTVLELLETDGRKVVEHIQKFADSPGDQSKRTAIDLLALAASQGNDETRQASLQAVPSVCTESLELMRFVASCDKIRGWGRGLRQAVQTWYQSIPLDVLSESVIRGEQFDGWTHRDLIRQSHPKPVSDQQREMFKWIVEGGEFAQNDRLNAVRELNNATSDRAARIIEEFHLPLESIATAQLNSMEVWAALFSAMPLEQVLENLAQMSRVGLLGADSGGMHAVVDRLTDPNEIRESKLHPVSILRARAEYLAGRRKRGEKLYKSQPAILSALDEAFHLAFQNVEPNGLRHMISIDLSKSMEGYTVAGSALTAREAALAMTLVTMAREPSTLAMGFGTSYRKLYLTPKMRFADALKVKSDTARGTTDCAQPMIYAKRHRIKADVFVIYTDNEMSWSDVAPATALEDYRQASGIDAKLVVVGMASKGMQVADPTDPRMLDILGFDESVPDVIREFVRM